MNYLGTGLGLRSEHYKEVLARKDVRVDWFEALTENYMGLKGHGAGRPLKILEQVRKNFPVVLHGVSMSIGSTDPLNREYLKKLKELASRIQPEWISDHLCWTGIGQNLHDLYPMPYTPEAIEHVSSRVKEVQDFLGREILLENVSSYLEYQESRMTEWEFLSEIVERTGCKLLLDVNNVFVSSVNHRFDPRKYIDAMPKHAVQQIHLAGHSVRKLGKGEEFLIDTHDHAVRDEVWDLFAYTIRKCGKVSSMIEWDDRIPSFKRLQAEAMKAKAILEEYGTRSAAKAFSEARP